jgi:hypothetical protein
MELGAVWRMLRRPLYTAGFVAILLAFGILDVYHTRFFHSGQGRSYVIYNLSRVLFLVYALGGLCGVGRWTLRRVGADTGGACRRVYDELLLTFFAGAAVTAAALFVLGFLNLYYYWLLAPVAVAVVAASETDVRYFGWRIWAEHLRPAVQDRHAGRRGLLIATAGCVGVLAATLLLVKGLYPGGSGDYYTHYFPYYLHVLQSHGLWPNDVWYHFYISKGATLIIGGILLTDPQTPEVLTYGFFMASAGCLYSLLRRYINNPFVPLAAVAGYVGAFVWTEAPGQISEWGIFQKHHEFTAALVVSVAWAAALFDDRTPETRRVWRWAVALFAGHAVLFAPTSFPLVAATLGFAAAAAAAKRRWGLARGLATGVVAASLMLAGILVLNYLITGMAEISPFRTYWRYADQPRFSKWVSPYLMVLLEEGSAPGMGEIQVVKPDRMTRWEYLRQLIRANAAAPYLPSEPGYWWVCVAGLVTLGLAGRLTRRPSAGPEVWRAAVPLLGALVTACAVSQLVTQPISVYRYFSFTTFFTVATVVGLWVLMFRAVPCRRLVPLTSYALPAVVTGWVTVATLTGIPETDVRHAVQFATGRISLAHAYATRLGVQMPVVEARQAAGDATARVYSFNQNNYSMAPGCEVESFVSFALHQDWHTVMFEEPVIAREALRAQGLNHFMIDLNAPVIDVIPYAPLFRPENIGRYFKVAWRKGDLYLLTWGDPDVLEDGLEPIPAEFFGGYNEKYFTRWNDFRPLYEQVRTIYEMNRGRSYPVYRDPDLPTVKGWQ